MSRPTLSTGKAVIIGAAMVVDTPAQPEANKPALNLHVQAAREAMTEAGIDRHQVQALLTAAPPPSQTNKEFNTLVLNELKVAPRYTAQVGTQCAGALGSLQIAASLVCTGLADYVVCSAGDTNSPSKVEPSNVASAIGDTEFEVPYGLTAPAVYAQMAQRYMYEYGITPENLARVAVANRSWAIDHPLAAMRGRGQLTVADVLDSPYVAEPLHLLDCAPWFPGGIACAVVVTHRELAESHTGSPISLLGFGQTTTHASITDRMGLQGLDDPFHQPSLLTTGTTAAARQAYEMSRLTPQDIDVVESSGPFTFFLLRALEELGFCGPGEAGTFVEKGGIDRGPGLPFNTFGGMLSFGQQSQALYPLIEAISQLRGDTGARQVFDAQVALVHGHGGPLSSQSVVIIGS